MKAGGFTSALPFLCFTIACGYGWPCLDLETQVTRTTSSALSLTPMACVANVFMNNVLGAFIVTLASCISSVNEGRRGPLEMSLSIILFIFVIIVCSISARLDGDQMAGSHLRKFHLCHHITYNHLHFHIILLHLVHV